MMCSTRTYVHILIVIPETGGYGRLKTNNHIYMDVPTYVNLILLQQAVGINRE